MKTSFKAKKNPRKQVTVYTSLAPVYVQDNKDGSFKVVKLEKPLGELTMSGTLWKLAINGLCDLLKS